MLNRDPGLSAFFPGDRKFIFPGYGQPRQQAISDPLWTRGQMDVWRVDELWIVD